MNERRHQILDELRALRQQFRELHASGMEALDSEDYETLGTVIEEERTVALKQRELIAEFASLNESPATQD